MLHPGVTGVAVFGVSPDRSDEEVMAVVVPDAPGTLTPHALVIFLQGHLAPHSIPRFIRFTDALPLTENGKIHKSALSELGLTDDTWDRQCDVAKV